MEMTILTRILFSNIYFSFIELIFTSNQNGMMFDWIE